MFRIGIIELKCENHEVGDLCRMADPGKHQVVLYTTRRLLPQIRQELKECVDQVECLTEEKGESTARYIKRLALHCSKQVDLVAINSLRLWEFLHFRPGCKVVSILSSLNWWFVDTRSVCNYVRKTLDWQNLRCPDPLINPVTGPLIRRILLSQLDGVIVEYPPFVDLVTKEFGYRKPVHFLPNRPFGGFPSERCGERLTFVVPGMISDLRRDYDLLLDSLELVDPHCRSAMRMVLLGNPVGTYGQSIMARCLQMRESGFDIDCPSGYVPADVLEEKLRAADMIISPIRFRYRSRTVTEAYTYTKGTGVFSDSIKFGKPSIVPEQYNVSDEIKHCFVRYRDREHLADLLEGFVKDRGRTDRLKAEVHRYYAARFGLAELREDFSRMASQVLGRSLPQ